MCDIRFTRCPGLPRMMRLGKFVGFFDDFQIIVGAIFPHQLHQVAKLSDGESSGRDLFTQCCHVDLPARLQEGTGCGRPSFNYNVGRRRQVLCVIEHLVLSMSSPRNITTKNTKGTNKPCTSNVSVCSKYLFLQKL